MNPFASEPHGPGAFFIEISFPNEGFPRSGEAVTAGD